MLVEHVLRSQDVGLLESILMPFDIYNDSADYALRVLKQRFLYDEIEAEVDLCFDQLVFKLSEQMFSHYKSLAASKMLDIGFLTTVENREKYAVFPKRYDHLFHVRRVKVCDHHNIFICCRHYFIVHSLKGLTLVLQKSYSKNI
jgi:cytoplasmic FMR1 interacting protein